MRTIITIAVVAVLAAGCSDPVRTADEGRAPRSQESPEAKAEMEVAFFRISADEFRVDICPPVRELRATGFTRSDLETFALGLFEESYGDRLTPAGRQALFDIINSC